MAEFTYTLQFAGISFVEDRGVPVIDQLSHSKETETKRNRPLPDLIDELNRLAPFRYGKEWWYPSSSLGRNLDALATRLTPGNDFVPEVAIGEWYYPPTASRWSVFRGLATSTQVKQMLLACRNDSEYLTGLTQGQFRMMAVPKGPINPFDQTAAFSITSDMYMLPPKPLGEHGGDFDGLYLVTLVDDRYYFQGTPISLVVSQDSTWKSLLVGLASVLGIVIENLVGFVSEEVYGQPEADSQLWTSFESTPALLDAVAANIGRVVVRNLNGTYSLLRANESRLLTVLDRNVGQSGIVRTAGGDYFVSGTRLPVGTSGLLRARNAVTPSYIYVTFPPYVIENDPVPHFLNARYKPQRPSAWFEEDYGEAYEVIVPITSGGIFVSGLVGIGETTLADTSKALLSGEIQFASGQALNHSGLHALAIQMAVDHYSWQTAIALDETWPGTVNVYPDGCHDLVWTYSTRTGQGTTRFVRSPWTQGIVNFQHGTLPIYSGVLIGSGALSGITVQRTTMTNTPRGVGGPSVAQTWRDSYLNSGTFLGATFIVSGTPDASGHTISSGTVLSGNIVVSGDLDNGYVFNLKKIRTQLKENLLSGQESILFADLAYFPTQNRWKGKINDELVYFEGTSGFAQSGVKVVYRGIDGTVMASGHASGSVVSWDAPDVTYGVNLVSYEKMQFVYPHAHTSGGIQEVRVVPQTQTVQVLAGSGYLMNGQLYYSGIVGIYDPAYTTSGPWISGEYVWLIDRNDPFLLMSGLLKSGPLSGGWAISGTPLYSGTSYSGLTFSGSLFSGYQASGKWTTWVTSGSRYDGQMLGFSPTNNGLSTAAPVYGVNPNPPWNMVVQSQSILKRSGYIVYSSPCPVYDIDKSPSLNVLQYKGFSLDVHNLMKINVVSGIFMTVHRSPWGYWYVGPSLDFGDC